MEEQLDTLLHEQTALKQDVSSLTAGLNHSVGNASSHPLPPAWAQYIWGSPQPVQPGPTSPNNVYSQLPINELKDLPHDMPHPAPSQIPVLAEGTVSDNDLMPQWFENEMMSAAEMFARAWSFPKPKINPVGFVNSLERVDVVDVAPEDMKCPFCWGNLGVVDSPDSEDEVVSELVTKLGKCSEREWHQRTKAEKSHDAVKLPCGHLFGHMCLVTIVKSGERLCPKCRKIMVA